MYVLICELYRAGFSHRPHRRLPRVLPSGRGAAALIKAKYKQECPSVEGKPPACYDLVDCSDLDLDLDSLTFISELDLDLVVTYLHAKN